MISTIHSDHRLDYLRRPLAHMSYGTLNAWALRRMDALVCVSDAMADEYTRRGFAPVYPIYNGLDFAALSPDAAQPLPEEWGIARKPGDILVVTAARFNPVKDLPTLIRGFVLCALPCFLTGGMHLDGFLDVTDAVRSCRSLERRREILKDSHVGSFAVLGAVLLLLGQFAAAASFEPGMDLRGLILIPVVSRCCSVLAILMLPPMTTSQYAGMQKKPMMLPVLTLIAALCGGFLFGWKCGLALVCTLLGAGMAVHQGYRSLQGMNGDISGYAITLAELAGLMAMAIAQ